ncbi:MAG: sulfotransferase family 2 domain-containing protein [Chloroflexota bacterium]
MTNQAQTAIFIHILKTAGTTLHHIIGRQYADDAMFSTWENNLHPNEAIPILEQMPEDEKAKIRIIKGHLPYGMHHYLNQPASYFTLLRDPVERVLSFYYFLRRNKEHYLYDMVNDPQRSLADFLKAEASIYLDNAQLRFITGLLYTVPYGALTDEHLDLAKVLLRTKYEVVGVTDEFDGVLLLLKRAYGWGNITYMSHNVTTKRPARESLSAEELGLIEKDNRYDQMLFEYVQELYEAKKVEYGPSFDSDLARFQQMNRLVAPLLRLQWRLRQVSVSGWLKRERNDRVTE